MNYAITPENFGNYTRAKVVFGFSCPHPNPLPGGEGVAILSPALPELVEGGEN